MYSLMDGEQFPTNVEWEIWSPYCIAVNCHWGGDFCKRALLFVDNVTAAVINISSVPGRISEVGLAKCFRCLWVISRYLQLALHTTENIFQILRCQHWVSKLPADWGPGIILGFSNIGYNPLLLATLGGEAGCGKFHLHTWNLCVYCQGSLQHATDKVFTSLRRPCYNLSLFLRCHQTLFL